MRLRDELHCVELRMRLGLEDIVKVVQRKTDCDRMDMFYERMMFTG